MVGWVRRNPWWTALIVAFLLYAYGSDYVESRNDERREQQVEENRQDCTEKWTAARMGSGTDYVAFLRSCELNGVDNTEPMDFNFPYVAPSPPPECNRYEDDCDGWREPISPGDYRYP